MSFITRQQTESTTAISNRARARGAHGYAVTANTAITKESEYEQITYTGTSSVANVAHVRGGVCQ
jgi:hypothetical protein